ncbi:MAG: hypothetical protein ACTSRN_02810, partial [Alphaproteobacteria bacterium]
MNSLFDATKAPIPYDLPRGSEARAKFDSFPENLLDLIEGTAGCSPYLEHLMNREGDWLRANADGDLDVVFATILNIQGDSFQDLSDNLRTA